MRAPVDVVMSKPVCSVTMNTLLERAYSDMRSYGTKKILVKDQNNKPVGVLEDWKITERDFDKKVKDIPLGKIEVRPEDTDIEEVETLLRSASAVYITARGDPNQIIGVVPSHDIHKSGY